MKKGGWRHVALLLTGFPFVLNAQTFIVKKDVSALRKEAKTNSASLKELKKGDTLVGEERQGMFWRVKDASGKDGFVSVLDVEKSLKSDQTVQNALKNRPQNEEVSARARSGNSVMGIRGLDSNSKMDKVEAAKPALDDVYKMEDRKVPSSNVKKIEKGVQQEVESKS